MTPTRDPSAAAAAFDLTRTTIGYYDHNAAMFAQRTLGHDVSRNHAALLDAIEGDPPFRILDFGCGSGRDLAYFRAQGHLAVGLEGAHALAALARQHSGAEVLVQNFLALELEVEFFDGIFANAAMFHVPRQSLARVLGELWAALKPSGVLFCSNPRGHNEEGLSGGRYGCYYDLQSWRNHLTAAGFAEIGHYYRPEGLPRHRQPWLATVWRKI